MVLPRWLARFNRLITNRLARPLAGSGRPFSVVVHLGRTSGKTYRTPVTVFESDGTFRIALTYGERADWVQNVLAAGEFWLEHRRTVVHLSNPRVVDVDPDSLPTPVTRALQAIGADQMLVATS